MYVKEVELIYFNKKLFNFLTLFTFHLLTYCKTFACNAYHINSWFCGNFLKEAVCALLLKSFVMSVSARCIYRFVCTIALQTIHEIEILLSGVHEAVLQCLKIAIVFELIYLYRAMSRVWLTSINIDLKCHIATLYINQIFLG